MFGLLSSSQIYGLQQAHEHHNATISNSTSNKHNSASTGSGKTYPDNSRQQRRRTTSSLPPDAAKESNKFFASLSSMQSIKTPTNFIEKFIKSELLTSYDTLKNYKSFHHPSAPATKQSPNQRRHRQQQYTNNDTDNCSSDSYNNQQYQRQSYPGGRLTGFNCLHGSYRSHCDGDFYEAVHINNQNRNTITKTTQRQPTPPSALSPSSSPSPPSTLEMTIKCSKNLLAEPTHQQAPATLQNYQKLPECEMNDILPSDGGGSGSGSGGIVTTSSGASSGEFNSSSDANNSSTTASSSLYKKLSFGRVSNKILDVAQVQSNEASDNSSASISTTATNSSGNTTNSKSKDLQRTSSASSSGDCTAAGARERKKSAGMDGARTEVPAPHSGGSNVKVLTPERAQRRKLMQMISSYDQQNKLLQRELAKEKRRRTEELSCVVKSLLCFESKLKTDMKGVNQRLQEKDTEICRLVRQNRALRKKLAKVQKDAQERVCDEGVVEDDAALDEPLDGERRERSSGQQPLTTADDEAEQEDCLVLEALQCINCRKQFYDIDLKEGWTQTSQSKDGSRNNDDHTTEHGSSSDDTVSSSFYGARRSVRYTSKRTSGTFRDYMRSRSMNIDDPSLDNNSEENTSTISRDDSQTSYEKLNIYSRTIERMHGVKCESERESEQSAGSGSGSGSGCGGSEILPRSCSRLSSKSSASEKSAPPMEEDDGIFSPTQDDDFDEDLEMNGGFGDRSLKIVTRRTMEFSEASPKQVYETSTDDWYASASDQEEIGSATTASKSYGHGAVNPVLECVNQILLQQSMEESVHDNSNSLEAPASGNDNGIQFRTPPKSANHLQVTASLPRRSSLSDRRSSSRSNSHSSEGQSSRNGTLTRKRVHFSTKNSMVHVPRNDEHDDDEDGDEDADVHTEMISTLQHYHPMNYYTQSTQTSIKSLHSGSSPASGKVLVEVSPEQERLETLNYESIYSNEYEPIIGSEHNDSNLYVDMESTNKMAAGSSPMDTKMPKMPPALPPKPANLLKFKKSLQQLDEMPDEHLQQDAANNTAASEPDYCSISEVNVNITSVQIVADVHHKAESEADNDSQSLEAMSELDLEVSTVVSDDTCAASQKTDEIEEIFADIPKLPNVAAIIAPKMPKYQQLQAHSDYLVMSPKVETANMKTQSARKLILNSGTPTKSEFLNVHTPTKSPKMQTSPLKLQLQLHATPPGQQYKRKHVPNILAEINKRMSLPNSPTTPTAKAMPTNAFKSKSLHSPNTLLKTLEESSTPNMPLQAEFDWYNLDAEYGKAPLNTPDLLKGNDSHGGSSMNVLAEITEDHESIVTTADEYNLDEEFSLGADKTDEMLDDPPEPEPETAADGQIATKSPNLETKAGLNAAICEAVNFPLFNENSPHVPPPNAKAKKIKKNLANFEKFIEGSGLSTKPLPNKRKIYFAGPFV